MNFMYEILDTDLTPQVAVTELKFAFTRNPDINSKAPMIKVHNLRASSELNGKVTSLICSPPEEEDEDDPDYWKHNLIMTAAIKLIKLDLKTCGIEETEMKELWYSDSGNTENMWGHGLVKHSRFSFSPGDLIYDYASKIFYMAKPILKGSEGCPGLGEFLMQEGFVVGQYHDVADLMVSLKKFFGVDVYPTFIGHGGYHPSLFEIGLLATRDCARRLPHPMSSKVPKGKFLMRHL